MANKRKPDNILRLNGTYQKHRHGDPSTKPKWSDDAPDMPACLTDAAAKEWKRIMSIAPAGVLTQTDRALLTQYCALWAELESDPLNFAIGKHAQLKLVQQELGFTPCSRGKIGGQRQTHDESGFKTLTR